MMHFTCDLCGQNLGSGKVRRYVVKMEIYPGFDPDYITTDDLDEDNLEAVAEIIRRQQNHGSDAGGHGSDEPNADERHDLTFDLCPGCHRKYLRDPLGRERRRELNFSSN